MVASSLRCQVVCLPDSTTIRPRMRRQPIDLLPWADPYIAQLLAKLSAAERSAPPGELPPSLDRGPRHWA